MQRWVLAVLGPIALIGSLSVNNPPAKRFQNDALWSAMQLSGPTDVANTPVLAAEPTGRLHAVWSIEKNGDASGGLVYARNDGQGWVANDIVTGASRSPSLFVDNDSKLHLVWLEGGGLMYSFAPVEEALEAPAWSPPLVVAEGNLYFPKVFRTTPEDLVIVVADLGEPSRLIVLRSSNAVFWEEASPFEMPDLSSAVEYPEYALAEDGTVHLTWSLVPTDSYYGGAGVMYSRSSDAGATWTVPTRLDQFGDESEALGPWQSSIQTVGADEVHVLWDAHSEGGRRYHQVSSDGGRSWSEPSPLPGGLVSQTGTNPMVVDGAGDLHLLTAGTFDWSKPQGIYHSTWDGSQWSVPSLIHLGSVEPHWLKLVVVKGTEIQLVWEAREQQPRAAWFATSADVAESTLQISYAAPDHALEYKGGGETEATSTRDEATSLDQASQGDRRVGEVVVRPSPRRNPSQPVGIASLAALVLVLAAIVTRRFTIRRSL